MFVIKLFILCLEFEMYPITVQPTRLKRMTYDVHQMKLPWQYSPGQERDSVAVTVAADAGDDTEDDYLVMPGAGDDSVVLMYPREVIQRAAAADNTLGMRSAFSRIVH